VLTWSDIGIVVRAVPLRRAHLLTRLIGQVDAFEDGCAIAYHKAGRTVPESYADALAEWGVARPWVMQLEDDAVLCPNFGEHALRVIREADAAQLPFVSLYSGRRPREGVSLPEPGNWELVSGSKFSMTQAFAVRSQLVADHNTFMLSFTEGRPYATDTATAAWMKSRRMRFARAWPSLVQHDDGGESLSGHRANPNRTSPSYRAVFRHR
jgi:hypothetical protein